MRLAGGERIATSTCEYRLFVVVRFLLEAPTRVELGDGLVVA